MERTLKGFYSLAFYDENTMELVGTPLFRPFRHEKAEVTTAANAKLLTGLQEMAARGRFRADPNPGAKENQDFMGVYMYHARYEDNGQIETPFALHPKCDLDSVERDELIALFNSL
jgi:hypothetical protein